MLLPLILALLVWCPLLPNARPATLETVTMYADRDSYISYNNPSTNYGGLSYMKFAIHSGDSDHAWIHFNLTALPADYFEVTLFVNIYGVSEEFNPRWLTYIQTSSYNPDFDWGEYSITYDKQPGLGADNITYFAVPPMARIPST